ncbi:DUF4446 family protein [Bariatricus massiliensis]|uniref:DUF4446 family protein n=1 Tax=Bariatricus massiliensis TaxID=1745713 RepID=A0ABS8DIA3_9FIRM|nr:DUF4446 family protein [Bariatricus massiliensis]MCB7305078.1 DUF4446 family protein [Bariatricus massiliensis]MCB7375581.1 DUF4446 family protein [Bariatricus massiliensis]MCB7388170.1 DUF4446 family protein [Bariatricus massiliensis]MCB7412394.1 DUF4446 family protein [Bariatricus massiliensis]MCQ5254624.1 DUF4446 family protein [Bariatricus massiliensis]
MESKILTAIGIDPAYIFILLIMLIVLMFLLYMNVNMKYSRLKSSYSSFMRGRDGKNLEESILEKFDELDEIADIAKKNRLDIKEIFHMIQSNYQKVGIVKYDAFNEMGGKLSFALTLLDGNNSGWIINAMHSREGCYTYIKEIVRGQSYIELADEEAESLEQAIYQEVYDPDVQEVVKKNL